MSHIHKLLLFALCITMLSQTLSAQNALEKAQQYAQLDAPFLSIKYLQKHISKQQKDKKAMLLLAETYLRVNMTKQSQEWMLRAHDCASAYDYYKKITRENAAAKALQYKGIQLMKPHVKTLYNRIEMESIAQVEMPDPNALIAAMRGVTMVL